MVFNGEDKVVIKVHLLKGYGPMKLMTEFPEGKNGKRTA